MRRLWQQIEGQLLEMSIRERALILVATLALVFGLWDTLLWGPISSVSVEDGSARERLEGELADLNMRSSELRARLSTDVHQDLRKQEQAVQHEIGRLDAQLETHTSHLIPPFEMTEVLQGLLANDERVRLVQLEALPAEALIRKSLSGGNIVYRQGMKLVLEAGFADTVAFVERIEALRWRFFWDALRYEVTEYPTARVEFVIYTLSTEEGWIGV